MPESMGSKISLWRHAQKDWSTGVLVVFSSERLQQPASSLQPLCACHHCIPVSDSQAQGIAHPPDSLFALYATRLCFPSLNTLFYGMSRGTICNAASCTKA